MTLTRKQWQAILDSLNTIELVDNDILTWDETTDMTDYIRENIIETTKNEFSLDIKAVFNTSETVKYEYHYGREKYYAEYDGLSLEFYPDNKNRYQYRIVSDDAVGTGYDLRSAYADYLNWKNKAA